MASFARFFPMDAKYSEEHYIIARKNRLDGICISFEYGNEDYHTSSERVDSYRLFIDYNSQDNKQNTVFFRDGIYMSGRLGINLLKSIRRSEKKIPPQSHKMLLECLLSLENDGDIVIEEVKEKSVIETTALDLRAASSA